MNDYAPDDTDSLPVRPAKPSMAPSWVMLGFVFGALFMWALPRHETPRAAVLEVASAPPRLLAAPPRFTVIENVFAEWGRYAVWENDLTEVALWNGEKRSFADFYEVVRSGDAIYFRTILRLTRPILTHGGVPADSPLQFTETQAKHDEWLSEKNQLTFRALSEAAQQNIPVLGSKPDANRK